MFPTLIIVTYAYICFSQRSNAPRGATSPLLGMLPYPMTVFQVLGTASAACLTPAYYPRPAARLVSCYALFR